MKLISIDPGYTGGITIWEDRKIKEIYPMPIRLVDTSKKKLNKKSLKREVVQEKEVDGVALSSILRPYQEEIAIIEAVSAMPNQGVSSMFRFGCGYGVVLGVLQSLGFEINKVHPAVWKKKLNLDDDKWNSIKLVLELYPEVSKFIKLKKHDGLAESALIGHYFVNYIKRGDS